MADKPTTAVSHQTPKKGFWLRILSKVKAFWKWIDAPPSHPKEEKTKLLAEIGRGRKDAKKQLFSKRINKLKELTDDPSLSKSGLLEHEVAVTKTEAEIGGFPPLKKLPKREQKQIKGTKDMWETTQQEDIGSDR